MFPPAATRIPGVYGHHPSMFLEDGVNVKYASEIKKHVRQSKVAAVGALAIPDIWKRSSLRQCDIVQLARGLICDPICR